MCDLVRGNGAKILSRKQFSRPFLVFFRVFFSRSGTAATFKVWDRCDARVYKARVVAAGGKERRRRHRRHYADARLCSNRASIGCAGRSRGGRGGGRGGGCAGMGKPGDETESEDEGASQEHAASRSAGLAGAPGGSEKAREGEDSASPRRRAVGNHDPSASRAFAEVWRPVPLIAPCSTSHALRVQRCTLGKGRPWRVLRVLPASPGRCFGARVATWGRATVHGECCA